MRLDNTEWFEAMRRYVSLSGLCVQEPGVAARRINKLNERIAQLEAERAELVASLEHMLREAFDAGSARAIASHRDFRQNQPNREQAVMKILAKHKEQA